MMRAPFPATSENRTKELLEIVHSDLCGPMQMESKGGTNYFITFIDDHSKWCEKIEVTRDVRFSQNHKDLPNIVFENFAPEDITIQREDSDTSNIANEEVKIEIKPIGNNRDILLNDNAVDHNAETEVNSRREPVTPGLYLVLRNKYKPDRTLERRKARIVTQEFAQRSGIHFNQTFASVARLSSIRLLVALASSHGMAMRQLDVATTYLNGSIEEEIFMEPSQSLTKSLNVIV
ncbi:retrotransposon ty1-copia subclass [Lasius niger]|uniref:Retrotransposon ty1-copia subclass n=1 Tax=Lasius niger TaxID=67767 RepID=A0A0J7N739_LASNI|nr:retrotransposon ty1-copia subclass [Lasius niger]